MKRTLHTLPQETKQQSMHWQFRTSGGVVLLHNITLGNTWLDGQHISCRSSAGRCLIIQLFARSSRPVISIFSYTSRNSCSVNVSVYRMTEAEITVTQWSQSRPQTSTTQGYKSWSHVMTNVLVPEVYTES